MRFLLTLLLMLPVASFTSPAHPAAGAAIVPAILGTWQAGRVLAVDRKTHQMHVDHSPVNPDLSDNSLMPYGQRIRLGSGYDKASDVAYWQIEWLVPYPANACQYPFLQFKCATGTKQPRQEPQSLEFTMEVDSKEYNDFFAPVGATKASSAYLLRCGANDEWVPQFYVSKDRQQMWCFVAVDDSKHYYGLQEYHRVAPATGKASAAPKN